MSGTRLAASIPPGRRVRTQQPRQVRKQAPSPPPMDRSMAINGDCEDDTKSIGPMPIMLYSEERQSVRYESHPSGYWKHLCSCTCSPSVGSVLAGVLLFLDNTWTGPPYSDVGSGKLSAAGLAEHASSPTFASCPLCPPIAGGSTALHTPLPGFLGLLETWSRYVPSFSSILPMTVGWRQHCPDPGPPNFPSGGHATCCHTVSSQVPVRLSPSFTPSPVSS